MMKIQANLTIVTIKELSFILAGGLRFEQRNPLVANMKNRS